MLASSLSGLDKVLNKDLLERIVQPKVSYNTGYISDTAVGGSQGSVAVKKNTLQVNNLLAGVTYTNWSFDWNDIDKLPFGNGVNTPIEEMHSVRLYATVPYPINDRWFWLSQVSLNATFEKELDNSYGGGAFSFASYKIDEDHSIQMGAFANYHPVASIALPVMSYSYRARERDGFQLILGFPRAYTGYFINPKTLLRGGMIFSQSVIKLAKDSPIEQGGYMQLRDYMGNFGVAYEVNKNFKLETDILYSLSRQFILYDSAGVEQENYGIAPSFGFNLRLRYLF